MKISTHSAGNWLVVHNMGSEFGNFPVPCMQLINCCFVLPYCYELRLPSTCNLSPMVPQQCTLNILLFFSTHCCVHLFDNNTVDLYSDNGLWIPPAFL